MTFEQNINFKLTKIIIYIPKISTKKEEENHVWQKEIGINILMSYIENTVFTMNYLNMTIL